MSLYGEIGEGELAYNGIHTIKYGRVAFFIFEALGELYGKG